MTLRQELAKALVAEGYRGRDGTYRRGEDSEWSVIVDVGPLNRRTDVSPQVGLRNEPVEAMDDSLRSLDGGPNAVTVGANVGYILGNDYTIWEPPATPVDVMAHIHMAIDVLRPYMALDRIPQALRDIPAAAANPSTHYRLVIVQLLLDNREGVFEALKAAEAEYCRCDDEICEGFNRFRKKVVARVPST